MEKENKTIIITTKAALKKNVPQQDYCYGNKNQNSLIKNNIKDKKLVIVFDITYSSKHKQGHKFYVKDHINKTGQNPIIGNKKIEFKDISKLYGSKNGITTTCCGKDLYLNHENPSHYLCFYAILIFYLGFTNIKGFIINYEK